MGPGISWAQQNGEEVPPPQQQERDQNLDQAARLTFQSAREAFSQGDYETALARFTQAYDLSGRSALLYNIAVTLDRLRRDAEALAKFREYLEVAPNAPDRAEVEARIRVLEQSVQNSEPEPDPDPEPEPEPDPDPEPTPEILDRPEEEEGGIGILHPAIALSVAGAAVVAGGLIVWSGLDASSKNDEYESYARSSGATLEEAERRFNDVRSAEKRTNALIGVAAGLGAGGSWSRCVYRLGGVWFE